MSSQSDKPIVPVFDSLSVGSVFYCGSAWGPRRVRVVSVSPGRLVCSFNCADGINRPHVVTSQEAFELGFEGMAEPMPDSPRPIWPKDIKPARIS